MDSAEIHAHVPLERVDDLFRLAQAHESVIDINAGELVADGSMDEGCGHG